ncbi:hypothetical protein RP20_CCG026725 [Aedes albopictus]|nr:hypothetical protein RP20_CCG026725 [Aedes albopictus]
MPIIVGGTNYYIESVLWQVLVGSGVRQERIRRRRSPSDEEEPGKKPKLITGHDDAPADASTSSGAGGSRPEESKSDSENENASKEAEAIAKKVRTEEEPRESEISGEDCGGGIAPDQVEKVLLMTTDQMEQQESTLLHGVLRRVDPVTADRLHPNNKRKIVR